MAYTTINKHTEHFNTLIWTGNGNATRSYTGVGFQPDLLWTKNRSASQNYMFTDAVRGLNKIVQSSTDSATITDPSSGYLSSFDSDGFSVQAGSSSTANFNTNSENYVGWNWKANGAGSANTDGTINSTVSVNTTAGFSIVKWTGNGVAGASIGHGLGVVPKLIMVKRLNDTANWTVYHASLGNTHRVELNATGASTSDGGAWNNTSPTSTLFYTGNNLTVGNNGSDYIAYCFAEKTGYSKFGSYTGIDASDNAFVYCGFAPSWIMFKRTDSTNSWGIFDNKRDALNPNQAVLDAENNNAESSGADVDFLSNGFKIRSASGLNGDGQYIYIAFGQSLVGSNNIPCTAR